MYFKNAFPVEKLCKDFLPFRVVLNKCCAYKQTCVVIVFLRFSNFFHHFETQIILSGDRKMSCSATGDPHMDTFDGNGFDMMEVGDYVMMRTTDNKTEVYHVIFQMKSIYVILLVYN